MNESPIISPQSYVYNISDLASPSQQRGSIVPPVSLELAEMVSMG